MDNTNTSWEPESIAIFRALAEGKFPLNRTVKDALDAIVKLAKANAVTPPTLTLEASGEQFSAPALANRIPRALLVNDTPKTSGFAKSGNTDQQQLASTTVTFTDGTVLPENSNVLVIF